MPRSKAKEPKARNGQGSVKKYPSMNRLVGQVTRKGKIVKRIYGTRGDFSPAEKLRIEHLLKDFLDLPVTTDPSGTVQTYMESFAQRGENDPHNRKLAPSTRDRYKKIIKYLPALGAKRLIDVQSADIEAALDGIKGDPKRGKTMARTRQIAYMFLHGVFAKAVKQRILKFNPVDGVEAPRYWREQEPTVFTREEQGFMREAARGTPYYALLLLALSVPVRIGELLGIRRCDVNFSDREIAIRVNLVETKENGYKPTLGPLKTRQSRRDLPMSDEVAAAFAKLLEAQMAAGRTTPDGLVFLSPEGKPVRQSHLFRRWFVPLLQAAAKEAEKAARAAGDRHYRFPVGSSLYDLRHTACDNMVERVPMNVFHVLAGHANAATSLGYYNKPSRKSRRSAVEAVSEYLKEDGDDGLAGTVAIR